MYADGNSVPQNDAEAIKWWRLAAEQGQAGAQHNLGYMYQSGTSVPQNDAEGVRLYRLAAKQGIARSQASLGMMYIGGRGVPQNTLRAYVWLSVAVAQGFEEARQQRENAYKELTPDKRALGQDIATRCFESDYQDCE
jgi:TPR repeat protein